MLYRFFCILAVLLAAYAAPAQLLSIDINGTVRPDVTAPGFTPWYMAADFTGTKQTVSRSFTNFVYTYDPSSGLPLTTNVSLVIPCTVTMVNPPIANATNYLNANYANKNGNATSSDPTVGWRLSEDGCWAHWKNDAITVDQRSPMAGPSASSSPTCPPASTPLPPIIMTSGAAPPAAPGTAPMS